jgi:hypothetical protein
MNTSWPRILHAIAAALLVVLATAGCKDSSTVASTPPSLPAASAPASATEPAALSAAVANDSAQSASYLAAKYDPIHFKPAIEQATDQQCLACHAEVLKPSVRKTAPAGLPAATAVAWYQQTSTYQGEQDTFHRRHLDTPYARQVMNLRCNTCHQGSDPRDRASGSSATTQPGLSLRKTVSPEGTCLKCHGQMNWPVMGLPGPWAEVKEPFQNNCVTACHVVFRTVRHEVNYLNAKAIEELAAQPEGGDVCYGCHGGRAWYRASYPYPRHPWPDMPTDVPDWAKNRPTQSEARFIIAGQGEKQ